MDLKSIYAKSKPKHLLILLSLGEASPMLLFLCMLSAPLLPSLFFFIVALYAFYKILEKYSSINMQAVLLSFLNLLIVVVAVLI